MGQQLNPPSTAKRCKLCGQRFTNDAFFCPFDGEPLEVAPEAFSPSDDPLVGCIIDDRYKILDYLGEGGMGTVYRVEHRTLQRQFAMKVLRCDLAKEPELGARFIQEARAAATVHHPNVIQITDFGQLPEGIPYFVMEYLTGRTLAAVLQKGGPLPATRAVRILLQAAAGIGAAHNAGVIHRDLKPDNIFLLNALGAEETVKLLDFGVAKVAGAARITQTGIVFGSPHYMSPEQASGQPVDHRADIYALGIVMYELFTGHLPFEADTFMGVLTKQMFVTPEPFNVKSGSARELGALEDITFRCLEKKTENRYASVEELIADIEEVVEIGNEDSFRVKASASSFSIRTPTEFRLSDELELPSAEELAALRGSQTQQNSRAFWAILAFAAAGLLVAIAITAFLWINKARYESSEAYATPTSTPSDLPANSVSVQQSPPQTPAEPAITPAIPDNSISVPTTRPTTPRSRHSTIPSPPKPSTSEPVD
ncbi:MAG TPA: protein kinase, partial [Polyangiaceae bacterium]|nr:protein kinase [Polyangiaceae bacterium]